MITAEVAAQVARKHGLSLNDASALVQLADDLDQAERLASIFAPEADAGATADEILRRAGKTVR